MSSVSVLILTKNEVRNLPGCLASVRFSDDVHVLDSCSEDRTQELASLSGARITVRPFDSWAAHQNWALRNLDFAHPWVLYIDADERVSPRLESSIHRAAAMPGDAVAFYIRRQDHCMGRPLRRAQMTAWYPRLFRPQRIRYERLVNPVTLIDGPAGRLEGLLLHYPFSKGLDHWLNRHRWYAALEAEQAMTEPGESLLRLLGTPGRRRQGLKRLFNRLPMRPALRFAYMYLVRGGFTDGRAGLRYCLLQAWYQQLIVQEEKRLRKK